VLHCKLLVYCTNDEVVLKTRLLKLSRHDEHDELSLIGPDQCSRIAPLLGGSLHVCVPCSSKLPINSPFNCAFWPKGPYPKPDSSGAAARHSSAKSHSEKLPCGSLTRPFTSRGFDRADFARLTDPLQWGSLGYSSFLVRCVEFARGTLINSGLVHAHQMQYRGYLRALRASRVPFNDAL
jgi:hypothetical protein